jgi:hypothetical protein
VVEAVAHDGGAPVIGGELSDVTNASRAKRDGVISKIRNSTTAQLWIVVAVAVAFFLAMRYLGIAGGCGPRNHSGQCGMSVLFMQVFGIIGAIIIVPSSKSAGLIVRWLE